MTWAGFCQGSAFTPTAPVDAGATGSGAAQEGSQVCAAASALWRAVTWQREQLQKRKPETESSPRTEYPNNRTWAQTQSRRLSKLSRTSLTMDTGHRGTELILGSPKESPMLSTHWDNSQCAPESTFLVDYAPGIQHIFIRQKFEDNLYSPLQLLFTLNSLFFFLMEK